jgi:hypothetical protein
MQLEAKLVGLGRAETGDRGWDGAIDLDDCGGELRPQDNQRTGHEGGTGGSAPHAGAEEGDGNQRQGSEDGPEDDLPGPRKGVTQAE